MRAYSGWSRAPSAVAWQKGVRYSLLDFLPLSLQAPLKPRPVHRVCVSLSLRATLTQRRPMFNISILVGVHACLLPRCKIGGARQGVREAT